MSGIKHEQRKRMVFDFLYKTPGGVLHRYKFPEHLSDVVLGVEVNQLVDDINQLIPTSYTEEDLTRVLEAINRQVRRAHGALGWPTAKVFIAATEASVKEVHQAISAHRPYFNRSADPSQIAAQKITWNQPCRENDLWGVRAVELLGQGSIDQATLDALRQRAVQNRKEMYGEDAALRWEAEAMQRHNAAMEAQCAPKREDEFYAPALTTRPAGEPGTPSGNATRR